MNDQQSEVVSTNVLALGSMDSNPPPEVEGKVGYMCKTDFDYHIEGDEMPTSIYSSVEALQQQRPCVRQCGIVKVRVTLEEVVQEETIQ